ncbi:aminotransferase class V-fold PLP-dependent enzyme [Halogeometricum borinquense]|uniref:Aminotransferase class V-fold PLP-dependent enzyme n=1 Tax=Halogeometricum borinquense TaxID=60847 RepID=A0A6C0UKT9_9EURY|nr:aminotransferase class V-fold PLP-dependent enzyme [Halogeometricum borinquense]QIB74459.1 aminotransferase class V-fold PLP-dependent enzyme [Halogeometricum borinquense]
MTSDSSIYDELGVPRVVNAAGTKTRIGGSLIRPEAVEAMSRAAEGFARISDLQARASELITDCTGAEAGYVASGAAAAMTLGTAACIAGDDVAAMDRLPDTEGRPDEVIMPRTHRTGYDHAIRAAGATIVDVGTNDPHLGTGSAAIEPWEIETAITEDTAAIAYLQKAYTTPPLSKVVEIAHRHDIPVLVDAAAEVPPKANLTRFIDAGVDLVVFSGGKAIRGPQSTGILAGRADLIESAAFQHLDMHAAAEVWDPPRDLLDPSAYDGVPRQGIGRTLKVGKEELVGLIRALELFLEEDQDELVAEWTDRTALLDAELTDVDTLSCETVGGGKVDVAPALHVTVDEDVAGMTAAELVLALRRENPRVFVGADALDDAKFVLNPMCLTDDEAKYVAERIRENLS